MSTQRSDTDHVETEQSTRKNALLKRAVSIGRKQVQNGWVPIVTGGVMLADAVRAQNPSRRVAVQAMAGTVLLGFGFQQRRVTGDHSREGGTLGVETDRESEATPTPEVETVVRRVRSNIPGTNPRGVTDEPDVETTTDPDEGDIQFTTGQDEAGESKPDLEEGSPVDPRYPDTDDPTTADDHVDIDLSAAAMADEVSEATGPVEEQAYPASEGTDPEPTAEKAPEQYQEGTTAKSDTDTGEQQSDDDIPETEDDNIPETEDNDTPDAEGESEEGDETPS